MVDRSELLQVSIGLHTFTGPLDEVIRNLCKIREECVKTHTEVEIQTERGGYASDLWIALRGSRPETAKEKQGRLRKEAAVVKRDAQSKVYQEQQEREEYARLKKKFES